jgi:hypothetical protein
LNYLDSSLKTEWLRVVCDKEEHKHVTDGRQDEAHPYQPNIRKSDTTLPWHRSYVLPTHMFLTFWLNNSALSFRQGGNTQCMSYESCCNSKISSKAIFPKSLWWNVYFIIKMAFSKSISMQNIFKSLVH